MDVGRRVLITCEALLPRPRCITFFALICLCHIRFDLWLGLGKIHQMSWAQDRVKIYRGVIGWFDRLVFKNNTIPIFGLFYNT